MNGYPADKLDQALEGVEVVVIPAGVPRKVRLSSSRPQLTTDAPVAAWRKSFIPLLHLAPVLTPAIDDP